MNHSRHAITATLAALLLTSSTTLAATDSSAPITVVRPVVATVSTETAKDSASIPAPIRVVRPSEASNAIPFNGMVTSKVAAVAATQNDTATTIPSGDKKVATHAVHAADTVTPDKAMGSIGLDTLREAKKYIFRDVPSTYWAAQSIATMTQQNLISGYSDGTFRPDKPLTREEAASLFSKLINEPSTVMISSTFSDITSDRWSALAIEAVARKNIISGYGDNTYRPEQFMSRQEFAVVADNYLHYLGYETQDPTILDNIAYSDQKFVASWAQDAVRELASLHFLHYNPRNLFNPEKYITRAEATEITYRMTQGDTGKAFKDTLMKQKTEAAADALIVRTFGKNYDFRQHGVKYWKGDTLWVAFANADDAKEYGAAIAFATDKSDLRHLRLTTGPLTQAAIDDMQTDAAYAYHQALADGTILDVYPNTSVKQLVIVVNHLPDAVKKDLAKRFPDVQFISEATRDSLSK
ncbi:S-layer homology domain-containing protein [uncultured Veillonella sp.]|uniref:S-layer homology domain-containing protein n=1 Tax=uncultured Veillonella sp. TaxID=159268 RepID=UPI0025963041|nr:S-layer homology domain-containing protein [uncultured Veillonella sp.]